MKKIVFLASGNGGNLKFLYLAQQYNFVSNIKLSVIADRECGAVKFAREKDLENYIINYKRSDTKELNDILEKINPDIIVTNWHKIIDDMTVGKFKGKLINLHYSLLPAFAGFIGVEPIKRAYDQGCRYIGPTCHFVDEGVDTGKIISQAIFTTDIPFYDAISLMFRKGCLVLLNGIKQVADIQCEMESRELFDQLQFSPALSFNECRFSETFWQELASL